MGIFDILKRSGKIAEGNVNHFLDKIEDPEKSMEQALRDLEEEYEKAKADVTMVIGQKNLAEARYKESLEEVEKYGKRAELAMEKGDENLARIALEEQTKAESLSETYKKSFEDLAARCNDLTSQLNQLEVQLKDAKTKKTLLVADAKIAKAQDQVNKTLGSNSKDSTKKAFDRMEEKVNRAKAEAEAGREINNSSIEEKFKALESSNTTNVDDKMAQLKAKMEAKKNENQQ